MSSATGMRQIFTVSKFLSLLVLGLCEYVRGALLFFILPIYVRGVLGLSPAVVGYALAAHYALDTGMRGPSGWLTDKLGQRLVMFVALCIGWIGILVMVYARSDLSVVAGCAILGLGISSVWPAVVSRVTQGLGPKSYATAMGGVMMAWLIGVGAGTVSMGWLLGNHVRGGFIGLLVVWLVSIPLSTVAMPSRRAVSPARRRHSLSHVVRDVISVRWLLPGLFVQNFTMGLLLPVFVLFVHYELHLDARVYSELLLVGGAATVLLQIPMGRLVDTYGYRPFLVAGYALGAVVLLVLGHLTTLSWTVVIAAGLGMSFALILPAWNSVVARCVPEQRRAVMWGIFMTVEGLGMAVGPLLGGELWDDIGPSAPFTFAAVILLLMMVFYGLVNLRPMMERRRANEEGKAVLKQQP